MIDFNHVVNNPNFNIQTFIGATSTSATNSPIYTWTKPRGSRMLWLIAVGGGGAGGTLSTSANNLNWGGNGGGSSGGASTLIVPSMFVPDILYIDVGKGGTPSITANVRNGSNTTIAIAENKTSFLGSNVLLGASGGNGGSAGSSTAGGAGGAAPTAFTINSNSLAGRGIYQFFAGQEGRAGGLTVVSTTGTVGTITGTGPWTATITNMTSITGLAAGMRITATNGTGSLGAGGTYIVASLVSATSITYTATGGTAPTAGTITNITSITGLSRSLPTNGIMVTGGAGGGGKTATIFGSGGQITGAGVQGFLPTIPGGSPDPDPTLPSGNGNNFIASRFLMNYGGSGGGSASESLGGNAGRGGDGAPGCGGGGGGAPPNGGGAGDGGYGGPGFAIIVSW